MTTDPTVSDQPLHHAATRIDWEARSATHYTPAGYAEEGFVHLSSPAQLPGTLHRHYPGRSDLVLLTIDQDRLGSAPIWEDLYGSGTEFPHVYAPLDLAAVSAVVPLPCDRDGRFDWWRADDPVVAAPDRPGTEAVHALLTHLSATGFDGAPQPRWRDGGLAAVSHLPGVTVGYPLPAWLRRTEPLEAVGALLRSAHDASVGHRIDRSWAAGPIDPDAGGGTVNHGDVGPGNLVWAIDRAEVATAEDPPVPVGLIDWEFAEPGPREYDLIDAAMNLAGHVPPERRTRGGLDGIDVVSRLDALAGGYGGYTAADLLRLAPDVVSTRLAEYRRRVAAGLDRWIELDAQGVGDRWAATLPYLRATAR
ncbi:MAG: DUF952 domain-containing protein [Actinomycetota bacterium]